MPAFTKDINVIARCTEQYRSARLAPLGLKASHCVYVLHVCRQPGISQEGLAKQIYINKSNVTRKLIQLEELGFVRREVSAADKRVIQVYPTQKAKEAYPEVKRVIQEWNAYLTQDMQEQELTLLMEMLEKIKEKAAAYQEKLAEEREGEEPL